MLSNILIKKIIVLLILLVILSIFYFSWIPDPDFIHLGYLPYNMAEWADHYKNFRTAMPFIILGILFGILEEISVFYSFLFFFVLVLICEFGQIFIPDRHFDSLDIFWGVFGGMLGLILIKGLSLLFSKFKNNY